MKRAAVTKNKVTEGATVVTPAFVERLTPYLTAGLTCLTVIAPLLPFDTAAAQWNNVLPLMLWLVLLVVWSLCGAARGGLVIRFDVTTIAVLVLTSLPLLSAVVLTLAGSVNGRYAINLGWQWLGFGLLFFYARQVLKNAADVRALAAVLLAVAVGLSVFALVQYFYLLPQARADYHANPEQVLADAQLHAPPGSPERKHFEDRLEAKEPIGTFALTNSFAGLLTPWLVLLVGIAIMGWSDPKTRRWSTGLILPLLVLLAVLFLTKSRTALLALIAGSGVALVYLSPLGRRVDARIPLGLGFLLVLALVGGIVSGGLDTQVLSEAPKSVLYRFQYWQATAAMIADYPLLGCGPGNFQETYLKYQLPEASENIADPHNFVLEIWATTGTLGFLALVAVAIGLAWQLWRNGPSAEDPATVRPTASYALQGLAALVGVALAYGIGFIAGLMPDYAILVSALPAGALFYAWLRPWVAQGTLTTPMLIAPLVALLVNLLAAGGIGFPGVSSSVWLLMAMLVCLTGGAERHLDQRAALGVSAVAVLLTLAFMFTLYRPVLDSTVHMQQAEQLIQQGNARGNEVEALLAQAAAADPLSPRPWLAQAALAHLELMRSDAPQAQQRFETAAQQALARDPRSLMTRQQLGDWCLEQYRYKGQAQDLAKAIAYYRQAIERYPNNARLHAQLAWALHLAGQDEVAENEAQQALELDSQHDHGEYKLKERNITDFAPATTDTGQFPKANGNAEQVMQQLRTASTP